MTFTVSSTLALSPDGNIVAFAAEGTADGLSHLWVQSLDGAPARALGNTDVSPNTPPPFWSHDGRFIVFSGANKIRKVDVSSGVVGSSSREPASSAPLASKPASSASSSSMVRWRCAGSLAIAR